MVHAHANISGALKIIPYYGQFFVELHVVFVFFCFVYVFMFKTNIHFLFAYFALMFSRYDMLNFVLVIFVFGLSRLAFDQYFI